MSTRTRTVNPRTRQNQNVSQPASPDKSNRNSSPQRQPKVTHHMDGFSMVEPNAAQREKITNAAAREEAQIKKIHEQRRAQAVQMMNQSGSTANRLGGGDVDMQEVRRRQVQQAEQQLKRAGRFPAVSSSASRLSSTVDTGDKLSDQKPNNDDYAAARKKLADRAEEQFRAK